MVVYLPLWVMIMLLYPLLVDLINEGEVDGCPVRLPMVEIKTISAGGGSLARVFGEG